MCFEDITDIKISDHSCRGLNHKIIFLIPCQHPKRNPSAKYQLSRSKGLGWAMISQEVEPIALCRSNGAEYNAPQRHLVADNILRSSATGTCKHLHIPYSVQRVETCRCRAGRRPVRNACSDVRMNTTYGVCA
ncbi:hypothetical protein EVAR_14767_1 [Eumeta japonica]|uniref:Uncharacterized protein n=1 Tax=Eumeta variegata TaxID=151549 RepID=A0A4C1TWW7_EUMVA|nr:hypothetical protein EVAR_14767_1 [Eumeta japonica]